MSDNYAIKRYHRQTVTPLGTSGKKKYLVIFGLVLLAGMAGMAYVVYTSGIFADDNPRIAPKLLGSINLERHANNLQPVQVDSSLANLAYTKSKEVKISQMNYAQGANPNPDDSTDVLVIPKISWALSSNDFQQQMAGSAENENSALRKNVLNPKYRTIGIGVTSDSYNYYIVTKWKDS